MPTTISPSLSASQYFIQGTSVNSFLQYARGLIPNLCRNESSVTYWITGSNNLRIKRSETNFFDDSFSNTVLTSIKSSSYSWRGRGFPQRAGWGDSINTLANIERYNRLHPDADDFTPIATASVAFGYTTLGSNPYKTTATPDYFWSGKTYGIPQSFTPGTPFVDSEDINASYSGSIYFLQDSNRMFYPVVENNSAAEDAEWSMNGVIEPLTIRAHIGGYSTFIGDHSDPEPHGIKANVWGGDLISVGRSACKISNWYNINKEVKLSPFQQPDTELYLGKLAGAIFPNSTGSFNMPNISMHEPSDGLPFNDLEKDTGIFDSIKSPEIKSLLIFSSSVSASLDYRPDKDAKSQPTGFVYEYAKYGVDSISYGGWLK